MLINTADTLDGADVKCVLTAEISGMMAFYFAASLIVVFTLQSLYLGFGEHNALFSGLLLQGVQALLH